MTQIEQFTELKIGPDDFDLLDELEKAAISISSYAVSEVNALLRIYLLNSHEIPKDDPIASALSIQRSTLMRAIIAKVFEFMDTVTDLEKRGKGDLAEALSKHRERLQDLKGEQGYSHARDVRNETANHYSVHAALKNLKHISKRADYKFYLHHLEGNSFFPIGEELMFVSRFNRKGMQLKTKEEIHAQFDVLQEWTLGARRWMNDLHIGLARDLLFSRMGEIRGRKMTYWLDQKMVGNYPMFTIPLFLRVDDSIVVDANT